MHKHTAKGERSLVALCAGVEGKKDSRAFLLHFRSMPARPREATRKTPTCAAEDEGCGELHDGESLSDER